MAKKKIKNILELAADLGDDPTFSHDLAVHLDRRRLVHALTALRGAKGLTQQDVATRIGCSQARISKLEAADDCDLSFGAVVQYAQALDLSVEITLTSRHVTAVERVQHHAFHIKQLTDSLARLALADEKIAAGVSRFFDEAAINLLHMLQDSARQLPAVSEGPTCAIGVDTCGVAEAGAHQGTF